MVNVDSNDEIFTTDEGFKDEALKLVEGIITDILTDISEFDSKLSKFDFEDYEFLINYCLESANIFTRLFEQSKYNKSVTNKMLELSNNYLEHIKKNNRSFSKDKVEFYNNLISRLNL